ncbi:MAG: hypothetical protein ACRDYD_02120, partial [Acidimicrobiales bacterium]
MATRFATTAEAPPEEALSEAAPDVWREVVGETISIVGLDSGGQLRVRLELLVCGHYQPVSAPGAATELAGPGQGAPELAGTAGAPRPRRRCRVCVRLAERGHPVPVLHASPEQREERLLSRCRPEALDAVELLAEGRGWAEEDRTLIETMRAHLAGTAGGSEAGQPSPRSRALDSTAVTDAAVLVDRLRRRSGLERATRAAADDVSELLART